VYSPFVRFVKKNIRFMFAYGSAGLNLQSAQGSIQ
jgi:hypothetical protein